MNYTHTTMLFAAFAIMTAQLPAQTDVPTPPVPAQPRYRIIDHPASQVPKPGAQAAPANPTPPPERHQERRDLSTREVVNIRLETVSGSLTFTVAGVEYVYRPNTRDSSTPATDVTACIAVLGELAKADTFQVKFLVQLPHFTVDRKLIYIDTLTIPVAKLK
jgi:hypothetical protein